MYKHNETRFPKTFKGPQRLPQMDHSPIDYHNKTKSVTSKDTSSPCINKQDGSSCKIYGHKQATDLLYVNNSSKILVRDEHLDQTTNMFDKYKNNENKKTSFKRNIDSATNRLSEAI